MTATAYQGVITRFLRDEERLIISNEREMPLVIEPAERKDLAFLQEFLANNSDQIILDMARYGAVLLRGFEVDSDEAFEKTVLSLPQFQGISDAFMAENGRIPVGNLKYVLHTNAVYKTGGTLYLGGFHTENYYSADVPGYICFYCFEPSEHGGETGIINTEKLYQNLNLELQKKLEKSSYFVGKWLISDIAKRYGISNSHVLKTAQNFDLPVVGEGDYQMLLMYKPHVFEHPLNSKKALQINLFELPGLNKQLRNCFMNDYAGKQWFWHRFFWKLPNRLFQSIEQLAVMCIAFLHSPRQSFAIIRNKYQTARALANNKKDVLSLQRVGQCFSKNDVRALAQSMRDNYCSCLWKKGDILLIDNKKVMHAGMPGIGPRTIRAMIGNPVQVPYHYAPTGAIKARERASKAVAEYLRE